MKWTPSNRASKRAAARLLKAYRSGAILITKPQEVLCVECCHRRRVTPQTRRILGEMWLHFGPELVTFAQPPGGQLEKKVDMADREILQALVA